MEDPINRFMRFVQKTDTCWIWKAQVMSSGYGRFWLDKKNVSAHRASWFLFIGKIPKDLCVLHKCDNPTCVNPNHLFIGTHKDNTQDMILKGRKGIPSHTKILQKQLKQIYSMHLEGVPQRQIAKKFKIHQGTVYKHIHKKYPIRPTIGEDNNKAILSKKKVIEMRLLYSEGNLSFKKIANLYGIEKSTAMRAIKGQTWKHV